MSKACAVLIVFTEKCPSCLHGNVKLFTLEPDFQSVLIRALRALFLHKQMAQRQQNLAVVVVV